MTLVFSVEVTFTGTKADASLGVVTHKFRTDGIFGLEPAAFPASFTDLESLSWTQTLPFHQFDNIALSFDSSDPLPTDPVDRDDCKKGGFADFGFRNQGQCVRFVEKNENGKDKR